MMSAETREQYRRMTTSERLAITFELIRFNLPALLQGPRELVDRRFELLRRQNDERNRLVLEKIAGSIKHGPTA